jgi:fido (protein-threonine AMPylation protein)
VSPGRQRFTEAEEARLTYERIRELAHEPIQGPFDIHHLKAVHNYIFQDLPHHQPGIIRSDTPDWIKSRVLEGGRTPYNVLYESQDIEKKVSQTLNRFGGRESIGMLPPQEAARRIAALYGDLDHAHPFFEGNSRTLREFTRTLALDAGLELDWVKTNVGQKERNQLYVARDLAVLERHYPGLDEKRGMATNDRAEYEAFLTIKALKKHVGDKTLEGILSGSLTLADRSRDAGHETRSPPSLDISHERDDDRSR